MESGSWSCGPRGLCTAKWYQARRSRHRRPTGVMPAVDREDVGRLRLRCGYGSSRVDGGRNTILIAMELGAVARRMGGGSRDRANANARGRRAPGWRGSRSRDGRRAVAGGPKTAPAPRWRQEDERAPDGRVFRLRPGHLRDAADRVRRSSGADPKRARSAVLERRRLTRTDREASSGDRRSRRRPRTGVGMDHLRQDRFARWLDLWKSHRAGRRLIARREARVQDSRPMPLWRGSNGTRRLRRARRKRRSATLASFMRRRFATG